jgi:hypothetical protein
MVFLPKHDHYFSPGRDFLQMCLGLRAVCCMEGFSVMRMFLGASGKQNNENLAPQYKIYSMYQIFFNIITFNAVLEAVFSSCIINS